MWYFVYSYDTEVTNSPSRPIIYTTLYETMCVFNRLYICALFRFLRKGVIVTFHIPAVVVRAGYALCNWTIVASFRCCPYGQVRRPPNHWVMRPHLLHCRTELWGGIIPSPVSTNTEAFPCVKEICIPPLTIYSWHVSVRGSAFARNYFRMTGVPYLTTVGLSSPCCNSSRNILRHWDCSSGIYSLIHFISRTTLYLIMV